MQVLLDAARQGEHPLFYGGGYFAYIANRFAPVFKNSCAPFDFTCEVFYFRLISVRFVLQFPQICLLYTSPSPRD